MTRILQREFIDSFDQQHKIKSIIKKERYKRTILYLEKFYSKGGVVITTKQLQEALYIADRMYMHQVVEGLAIVGVLIKTKDPKSSRVRYFKNNDWWEFVIQQINNEKKVEDGA